MNLPDALREKIDAELGTWEYNLLAYSKDPASNQLKERRIK